MLNEVGNDGVSTEMQSWFRDRSGEANVSEVPDWADEKHERLCNRYTQIAVHVKKVP